MRAIEQVIISRKEAESNGETEVMYGYCKMSEAWLPRSAMLSAHVKMFDSRGDAHVIKMRLSPDMWSELKAQLEELDWENRLLPRDEIPLGEAIIDNDFGTDGIELVEPKRQNEHGKGAEPWWVKGGGYN